MQALTILTLTIRSCMSQYQAHQRHSAPPLHHSCQLLPGILLQSQRQKPQESVYKIKILVIAYFVVKLDQWFLAFFLSLPIFVPQKFCGPIKFYERKKYKIDIKQKTLEYISCKIKYSDTKKSKFISTTSFLKLICVGPSQNISLADQWAKTYWLRTAALNKLKQINLKFYNCATEHSPTSLFRLSGFN